MTKFCKKHILDETWDKQCSSNKKIIPKKSRCMRTAEKPCNKLKNLILKLKILKSKLDNPKNLSILCVNCDFT